VGHKKTSTNWEYYIKTLSVKTFVDEQQIRGKTYSSDSTFYIVRGALLNFYYNPDLLLQTLLFLRDNPCETQAQHLNLVNVQKDRDFKLVFENK
jgi:hypothetical protein